MMKRFAFAIAVLAAAAGAFAQASQPEVSYADDFQSYGTPKNPPGWVDTSIGSSTPVAGGLFKTWPDPLQGNKATNIVYGTKSSSGKADPATGRMGIFSTLTTKNFAGKGRFEFRGRFLRSDLNGRVGVTFFSSYPEKDSYYLIGLWPQGTSTALTMRLMSFGTAAPTGTIDSSFTPETNKWYQFLVQVDDADNTTSIRARFWPDGTTEPKTFSIDAKDASATRLKAGRIGIWSANGDSYFDDITAKSPVDHTPPVVTFIDADTQRTLDPSVLALFKQPARIDVKVTDDLSTTTYTAQLDGSAWAALTPIAVDGTHKITVHAVDGPGNATDATLNLLVDQVPPQLMLQANGATFANGQVFDKDVTVTATVTDISKTTTTAKLDGTSVALPASTAEEKLHEISVTAVDQVGWSTTATQNFYVDKSAPVIAIKANGQDLADGASFQTDVTLSFSATDLTLDNVTATLDGNPFTSGTVVTTEAVHTVVVTATDKAHHTSTETRKFVVDKTAPAVTLLANGQPFVAGTAFAGPVTFTTQVHDATSVTQVATLDDHAYTLGTSITVEGPHTIKVVATNAAGLSTTVGPYPFTIDVTKPVVTLTESGSAFTEGMKFNRDVNPVVTATDNLTASPDRVLLVDGKPFPLDTPVSEEKRDHTISASATDAAGNTSSVGPFHFMLDKTKPVVTITDGDGKSFPADALFNHPVVVKVKVVDLTNVTLAAKLNDQAFSFDGGVKQSDGSVLFTSSAVTNDGVNYVVSVVATDEVGNKSDAASVTFSIDQTPPHLTFTAPPNNVTVSTPTILMQGTSDDAQTVTVNGLTALVDLTAKTFAVTGVPLLEGRNEIVATGIDKAGNSGSATLVVNLDTRAPDLVISAPTANACMNASSITVTGQMSDLNAHDVKVSITPGSVAPVDVTPASDGTFTASIAAPAEGKFTITVEAADAVGHVTSGSVPVVIDRTAPSIVVTNNGAPFAGGFVNHPPSLFIRANDADPSATLTVTLNGQPFVSGSTVSADGSYTLKANARDCAGNASPETSIAFTVDTVAPRIVTLDPAEGSTITTAQKTITGTFDSSDAKSLTIDGTSYAATINGASFSLAGVALSEGTNRFVLVATDSAGNQSRTPYSFNVKTTTPSVSITENGSPIAPNALFNRTVTPLITSSEPAATIAATLDGNAYTSGTPISSEGAHTLRATASDAYGHTSPQASATFTIDRTPPVVTITSPADNSTTTTDRVDVRGTASGGDVASVTINGAAASVGSDGSFTLTNVALEIGPNTILAAATDRAGNTGTASATITRSDKLAIILTSPADKTLTNRHTITVAGQLLTPGGATSVSINGSDVPVDVNGAFTKTDFALTEGTNTITATVRNAAGTANSVSVTVTADFTPPVLRVLADGSDLQNDARFATSPSITLQATDNRTDPITTKLTVDGSVVTAPVTGLANGGHALSAVARDAAGNEARVDRTFAIGAGANASGGCSLTSFDPANNSSIYTGTIKISGRSGGASNVLVKNVRALMADGSFASVITLQPGRNDITIQCADANGNATTDAPVTLTLYRYTDATITITSPANDSIATTPNVTVTGTVTDGVVSGDVNTLAFTPANGTYSVSNVPLANGLNILTANARTSSARIGSASVRVKYFGGTPQIAITSPLPGTTTGATTIDVTGTYVNVDPSTIALSTGTPVQVKAQSDTTGIFIANGVTLAPNAKTTITVTGRSRTNATATASTDVTTSGNAAISIASPLDNTAFRSTTNSVHVTGTFTPVAGSQVSVNGVAATLDTNGNFAADLDLTTATTSSIPIVARVTTADGQSATDAIRIIRFTAPLSVIDTFPTPNAVEVSSGVLIVVRFSNSIDASTAAASLKLTDASNANVDGETFVDNEIVSFAPVAPLTPGMHYTFTVAQTLKDLAGGTLASPYSLPFTVAVTAPSIAPTVDQSDAAGCFTKTTITGTATTPGARVRLDVDGVTLQTNSDATTGKFSFEFTFSGQPGFHIARVRQVASDGTLSAESDIRYQINCAGPQVVASSLDRAAKKVTITFSKPMKLSSLVASPSGTIVINNFTGTVSLNASGDVATVQLTDDVSSAVVTLTVLKTVQDTTGATMAADYTQTFTLSSAQPTGGYVSGAVYDATNGRPLQGATVNILTNSTTDDHGRYTRAVDEGVYTIQASAPGYTTVWRQIVVPSGSGVIPIDIRLTRRGPQVTSTGAAITHGGDTTVTKRVELIAPSGTSLTLTSVGAQSLAGLLPLGWSPVAAAEVAPLNVALAGGKLTFILNGSDVAAITAATQTLSLAQYDETRDEWRVVSAVANVGSDGRVAFDITTSGNYALVYPDKAANLAHPSPARTGAPLAGVANPCTSTPDVCRMTSKSFEFTPKSVLPNGRAVANLVVDGVAKSFPSGTAVQAFIDEQLNLADGRVVIDPPFATDLLIYRNFAGDSGLADFHLSPTTQAAALTLRDGNDHIRVVDYPGRIDRGALIGSEGGRVPGDDGITIDIPTGATAEPLHASASTIADLAQFASIPGFHIVGAFTFSLSRATEPTPIDADGDGQPDPIAPPSLLKPATATFTIPATTSQVIVAELLPNTPFGAAARLASQTQRITDTRYSSVLSPQSSVLYVDGIIRDGRYLILTADNPIAFAKGKVINAGTTLAVANARVSTSNLGITDITRTGGLFAIPVIAKPAAPFTLTPRSTSIGDGDTYTAASSPDANAIVDVGTLTLAAHPPQLTSLTPANGSVKNAGDPLVVTATFDRAIDTSSLANAIVVVNLNDSTTVSGNIAGAANTVTFTGASKLNAGTRYSITIAPTIRAMNGAAYGRTTIATFSTPAIPVGDNTIHSELITITIPDANGVSTITGKPGSLPPGAQAVAVRRGNFFVTGYQTTVASDKSFTFTAGGPGVDRITTSDLIDLQVIDATSRAIIAIIPLTPFVTADGFGFVAPVTDHDVRFTNPQGISLIVPAGAFSTPTLVRVTSSDKSALDAVPSFDHDLHFSAAARVDFDGIANKRLQLEIPVPANFQMPDHELMLGRLGESIRGPRIMIVDTIRVADGKFTTTDDGTSSGSSLSRRATTQSVLLGKDVKKDLLGILNAGVYNVVNIQIPIPSGWAVIQGMQGGIDMLWDIFASLYVSDFYLTEGRGRVAIPVLVNTPMKIEGIDATTGFKVFEKQYPNADSGIIENPNPDVTGPYPVFTTPANVQQVDVVDDDLRVRNFHLKLVGNNLSVEWNSTEPPAMRLREGVKVQALNTANGDSTYPVAVNSDGSFNLGVLSAKRGDRIILIAGAADIAAGTDISVVFNEAIDLSSVTNASSILEFAAYVGTTKSDFTDQVKLDLDSSGRRLNIAMPSGQLIRGARYELTLKAGTTGIKDLAGNPLGRGVTVIGTTTTPTGGNRDLVMSFKIRDQLPSFGDFQIDPASGLYNGGSVRDLAQYGGILFVSALDGGLLAYDLADPASLKSSSTGVQPKPLAVVPGKWPNIAPGMDEHWAVATDHHGRVYSTGFTGVFAALRSYRVEDFLAASTGTSTCGSTAPANALCKFHGAAIVGWRPGYSSSLDLASGQVLSDRAEGTPRKLQLLVQDDEENYATLADFKLAYPSAATTSSYPDDFEKLSVSLKYIPSSDQKYLSQRITVENVTRDMRWSIDVPAGQQLSLPGVIARKGDHLKVYRNERTYGVVTMFGYGVAVFDLNAVESNDAPNRPSSYSPIREQILATKGDAASSCSPMTLPPTGAIANLTFSPEAVVVPTSNPTQLVGFASEVHNGLLGFGVPLGFETQVSGTTSECVVRDFGMVPMNDPRLGPIRQAFTAAGRTLRPRYGSLSYYRGELAGNPMDYVLVAAGDLGLLAYNVGPEASPYLSNEALAGVVWVPQGVVAVRMIPGSHLATIVDGSGRVLIVDVAGIDERLDSTGAITTGLFKTTALALNAVPASPGQIGVDDPRIIWKSAPGFMSNTLPPFVDPDTGMLVSGDVTSKTMRVAPAFDPAVKMMIDTGSGMKSVDGITPLGIAPRADFIDTTQPDASSAAFRLQVSLPAGAAKALDSLTPSHPLQLAVESEWVPNVVTAQTPVSYPKAHLRTKQSNGDPDARPTNIVLHRDVPSALEDEIRYQRGAVHYVSDWIVPIADARASEKWKWNGTSVDKAAAGCANCDRPARLKGKSESDNVFELWTAGHYISVRPDGESINNILTGTPYDYLGRNGRMQARFTTIRARKVRPTEVLVPAHNPPVADGMLQETHFIHSGEVETASTDLDAGGRGGVDVVVGRTYRSRTIGGTELGEGWDSPIFRFVLPLPNGDVEYHDGSGEIWTFKVNSSTGALDAPKGLFVKLLHTQRGYMMFDQKWRIAEFNDLGQLVSESDEFYSPADSDSGNIIRYIYDETGRLTRVVDPLGRATKLTYENDRLAQVDAEWRHRSVKYHYDTFGRLTSVELPETKAAAGVPATYDHTGTNRPVVQYTYQPVTQPQPNEPLQSQTYTDFAELGGDLTSIKDPEQVKAGITAPARVTFTYDISTDPAKRDHNLTQQWASGETATFEPHPNGYVDVLGQHRSYTLTPVGSFDGRRHILSKRDLDVAVMDAAASGLPDAITPLLNPTTHPQLETTFDYNDQGMATMITMPSGLVEKDSWVPAVGGAPGMVLANKKETAPGGTGYIETDFGFDSVDNATANLKRVGRRDNPALSFIYRDQQTPSRGRSTIESNDSNVKAKASFNKHGQIEHAQSDDASGGTSMESKIEYYDPSTSNPIESGKPRHITRGGNAVSSSSTYSLSGDGLETEVTKDDISGVVTTITKDADGRMVSRKVQAPATSSSVVVPPSVTEELFGYNADGKLAYQRRVQSGIPGDAVVTTLSYDALGRDTGSETTNAKVLIDPSVAGSDTFVSIKTKKSYNLATREVTTFDSFRVDETTAPRTVTTLDRLGRTISAERKSADGTVSVKTVSAYDIHGQKAYESDLSRVATLTQNDYFGRPIASISTDGTRGDAAYDAWDEPIESHGYAKKVSAAPPEMTAHSRSVYTDNGRVQLSVDQIDTTGRSRGAGTTWLQGDAVTAQRIGAMGFTDPTFGSTTNVRVMQTTRDAAGRVVSQMAGDAVGPDALVDPQRAFVEDRVTDYRGDLAMKRESREPRVARKTETSTGYDGLGRPIVMIEGNGAYTSYSNYDEAGNQTLAQPAGMQAVTMQYDSRGAMHLQTFSNGKKIQRVYDERGALRQYIDEQGHVTFTDVDGLGRPTKTRYPDGTFEQTIYENGTGVVSARRDRAGRWVWFKYEPNGGRLFEEHHGGSGIAPSFTDDPFIRYTYDDAGRLIRVAGADAAIEYDNFDLLGRPAVTRTIRYKKTGCIPAAVPCGSGLTSAQIAEEYTQGHEWSVFDGERTRWRLPVVGSTLPSNEVASSWRNWIDEQRDGGANLIKQQEALSRTSSASGATLNQSIARGAGRLAQRQLGSVTTRFGYADLADATASAIAPANPVAPGAPTGSLGRAESIVGTHTIAGTEITLGSKKLIETAKDLGLAARSSNWSYDDDRGWLKHTVLLEHDGATSNEPVANTNVRDASVLDQRDINPPRLGATDVSLLSNASSLVPLSWSADAVTDANQVTHRAFSNGGVASGDQTFTWTGGRREDNGIWRLTYDDRGRVIAKDSVDRHIAFDYDPNDRIVGRISYQKDSAGALTIESRASVLARDGLPAETTFVWDPITDRLVAMYDSAAVQVATTPVVETGLLRQYIHGDESYDDPVEVLITSAPGIAPQHYVPILDQAGAGSLQAVADNTGKLVERVLYADSFGDAPRYLQGAVADHITVANNAGTRSIAIHFTESVDATTIAAGTRLVALDQSGSILCTATTAPTLSSDEHTLTWTINSADWTTLTQGAQSVQIGVSNTLRFPAWGTTPLQQVASWETILGRATSSTNFPLLKTAQLAEFNSAVTIYDVPDLYLVAHTESISKLLFDFHGLPFRDPADGLIFARARWYDPSTGSFVSDDPMGYKDTSNLYAYAANDPVNGRDPRGESATVLGGAIGLAFGGGWAIGSAINDCIIHDTCQGIGHYTSQVAQFGIIGAELGASVDTGGLAGATLGGAAMESFGAASRGDWSEFGQAQLKGGAMGFAFGAVVEVAAPLLKAIPGVTALSETVANSRAVQAAKSFVGETAEKVGVTKFVENLAELSESTSFKSLANRAARREAGAVEQAVLREAHNAGESVEAFEAKSMEPCPVGACLLGNTAVATPVGFKAIEELRVGDRVSSTFIDSQHEDGWTQVDGTNWHVVKMRMANPQQPGDSYEIEMLRPVEWIVAHEAYPGHRIDLATERNTRDDAYIISVAPAPPIAVGSGRVVLATYAHRDEVLSLRLENSAQPVETSPWHRLYSRDRNEWVTARDLHIGEHIRTKSGESTIRGIEYASAARVFDIEVEGDHAYYIAGIQALTHNCGSTQFIDGNGRLRNADGTFASGGETAAAEHGRQAHLNYRNTLGEGYDFEQTIKPGKGGYRVDAINYEKRIVRELKPDNPRAISRGWRQINRYREHLEKLTGEEWTGYVDVYKR